MLAVFPRHDDLARGRPTTVRAISPGAARLRARPATIDAPRSASGADPNSRVRAIPISCTPRSTRSLCARRRTGSAPPVQLCHVLSSATPASPDHSPIRMAVGDHDDAGPDHSRHRPRCPRARCGSRSTGAAWPCRAPCLPPPRRLRPPARRARRCRRSPAWRASGRPDLPRAQNDDGRTSVLYGAMSQVTLITGGTRGIGHALALGCWRGATGVAVTGTTASGVAARDATRWPRRATTRDAVLALECDVRDRAAVDLAMQTVVAHFGGIDVLVNNAGVGVGAPIADLSHDEWSRIIDTNLTGVFHCCKRGDPAHACSAAAAGSSTSAAWPARTRSSAARPTARRRPVSTRSARR